MKRALLVCSCIFLSCCLNAQVTSISILDHNTGGGNHNNLFNYYIAAGTDAYIDYEIAAVGLTSSDPCGTKTQSRIVVRTTGSSDPKSVVASTPVYVTGICNGKNGNNDKYYVNLKSVINTAGRYSIEIQADVAGAANPYDNTSTGTNWNYVCPPAYYLMGTSGPTGQYYTPFNPPCYSTAGKSDPVGGSNVDSIKSVGGNLNYFTVGEMATYREMVVFAGNYFDMSNGRFQPGNPALPDSINGVGTIPAPGVCLSNDDIPVLSMGAEINTLKRTDCSADIMGATMFYRVYKNGTTAPAWSSFNIPWYDNCPGPSGPVSNIFPSGGSCNNINNVLDQRWQNPNGVSNILPTTLTVNDSGVWNIDFYIETYTKNCAGTNQTITGAMNTTHFTVLTDTQSLLQGCSGILPLFHVELAADLYDHKAMLRWVADNPPSYAFYIERSEDGQRFKRLSKINGTQHSYIDNAIPAGNAHYYRIVMLDERNATVAISNTVRLNTDARSGMSVMATGATVRLLLNNISAGNYDCSIYTSDGRRLFQRNLQVISSSSYQLLNIGHELSRGLYHIVLTDRNGRMVASARLVQ